MELFCDSSDTTYVSTSYCIDPLWSVLNFLFMSLTTVGCCIGNRKVAFRLDSNDSKAYEALTPWCLCHQAIQETHQLRSANVNFLYDDIAHVLQSTAPPPQTVQHGEVTAQTEKYQPEAKRQNITVK